MLATFRPSLLTPLRVAGTRGFAQSGVLAAGKKKAVDGSGEPIVKPVKEKAPKLPKIPKGPPSAYALFVKDLFTKDKSRFVSPATGKVELGSIAGELSDAWKNLSVSDKDSFAEQAGKLRKEFEGVYSAWYNGLDKETKRAVEAKAGKKLTVVGGSRQSKQLERKRTGEPHKPMPAFFLWLNEFRKTQEKGIPTKEVSKRAAPIWKGMSDAEKAPYVDMAEQHKKEYRAWKDAHPTEA